MIWGLLALLVLLAGAAYALHRGGAKEAQGEAAGEALDDVTNANRAVDPRDAERVRRKYERD